VSGCSFTNADAASTISVTGNTISQDAAWTADVPYIISGSITVKGSGAMATLTLLPGAVLKFSQNSSMNIGATSGDQGALIAQGTFANPITFTSNEETPAAGDWDYIRFYNTTDAATTVLDHCNVQYAGDGNQGAINIKEASPTIRNTTVTDSASYGIRVITGSPIVESCRFNGNGNYDLYYTGIVGGSVTETTITSGIYLLATTNTVAFSGNTITYNNTYPIKAYASSVGPIVSGCSFTNVDAASTISVTGNTISQDAAWTADVPYVVSGDITGRHGHPDPSARRRAQIQPKQLHENRRHIRRSGRLDRPGHRLRAHCLYFQPSLTDSR
jgi:hypothetical protein